LGNELVFIDGQEGFIDLVIPLKGKIESAYTDILSGTVAWWEHKTFTAGSIPTRFGLGVPTRVMHKLLSFRISMNHLRQSYCHNYANYEHAINKLQDAIWNCQSVVGRQKLTRTLKKLMLIEKSMECMELDMDVLGSLLALVPLKYITYDKQVIEWKNDSKDWHVVIDTLKIATQAISFLEQQNELGRVSFDRKQRAMVQAMRECMSIHEEGQDFDTYINKWSDKILTEIGLKEKIEFKKKQDREKNTKRARELRQLMRSKVEQSKESNMSSS
jgi:hypothetical protein